MFRSPGKGNFVFTAALVGIWVGTAGAQSSGGTSPGAAPLNSNYHIGFERPESWGLKYFGSVSLLSGFPAPQSEGDPVGTVTVGLEMDWLPLLDAGQQRIGFNGTEPEGLNHAPIFARPMIRVRLPDQFSVIVAAPRPCNCLACARTCWRSAWSARWSSGATGRWGGADTARPAPSRAPSPVRTAFLDSRRGLPAIPRAV